MIIQTETNAFETVARGVAYYARKDILNRWEVHSRRLALGSLRNNIGTIRHFNSLGELAASIKAFRGIDQFANH